MGTTKTKTGMVQFSLSLEKDFKLDHSCLGLGGVDHPLVVSSALHMDQLTNEILHGAGVELYNDQRRVVVFLFSFVGEVFDWETLCRRHVFHPCIECLFVSSVATLAITKI